MYKAERAIIMAAGKGERLRPVTQTIPKPLVSVNGVRMIDSVLEALHANGIQEIYVVVGYLKECFADWAKQRPGVRLIENPCFDSCNNISSLYFAREHLENTLILDGDQLIGDPSVLTPDFERSGYNAVWTDEETDEWLLTVENGIITHCSRTGGRGGWQLFSVSRWNAEDGKRLRTHLELEFEHNKNGGIYWDDVALFCHPKDYELGIHPMRRDSVREIDSFAELCAIDPSYKEGGRI